MGVIDTFTDTDATALTSHTPSGGGSWTNHASWASSSATIRTNRAAPGTSESVVYHSTAVADRASTTWVAYCPLKYVATNTGSYGGLWAGVTGAKTGYVVYWYAGDYALYKYDASGGNASLGTYTAGFVVGDEPTVALKFTSTQVIVLINGTARITASDTAITPTRVGVYGVTSDATKGFHVSDITYVTSPSTPTLSTSGTLSGITLGADKYGRAIFKVTETSGDLTTSVSTIERSSDNSTWTDVTSLVTNAGTSSPFLVSDNRPHRGTQSIAAGGTAYYRAKVTNAAGASGYSTALTISTVGVNKTSVHSEWGQANYDYLSVSGNANTEADGAYPGTWLTSLAYLARNSYAPTSGSYLTLCSTFWALIKSRGNINADYVHTPASYTGTTGIRRDFHWRLVLHLLVAARLLRQMDDGTADTLAADLEDYANRMGKGAFAKLSVSETFYKRLSNLVTGSDGYSTLTAWGAGQPIAAGEVRKRTAGGTYCFRALNAGTTGGSEPSWVTTEMGHTTDNDITWEEMSFTCSPFSATYSSVNYAPTGGYTWDGNQITETAAALLLLRSLSGSDFYPGGSHATTGYDHAISMLKWSSVFQYTDGAVALGGGGLNTRDTHYGSFQLHTTAMAVHLLPTGTVPQADLWLSRALSWFTGSYSVEPTISNAGGSGYATYQISAELVWRAAGYEVSGTANPLEDIEYRAVFNVGDSSVSTHASWYEYAANGWAPGNTIQPYAYNFESVADYQAVLGTRDQAYTADGVVVARNTRTYTADGIVYGVVSRTYTADGVVAATTTRAYTADGHVVDATATTRSTTYTADGLVQATVTRTYTAGGYVATASPEPPDPPQDPEPGFTMFFDIGPYL